MDTETALKSARVARAYMKARVDDLSPNQLLNIPPGATNSVLWNIGHIVLSHYRLLHRPCGGSAPLPQAWEGWFMPGTSPANWGANGPALETVMSEFNTQTDRVESEVRKGTFGNYKSFKLKSGYTLDNAVEALNFNVMHEGIHIGAIIALRHQMGIGDVE